MATARSRQQQFLVILGRYAVAMACVGTALAISFLLRPVAFFEQYSGPYLLFTAAVIVSAFRGGFWCGVTATVLSALATAYFRLPPLFSLRVESAADLVLLALFLAEGVLVSGLTTVETRGQPFSPLGRSALTRYGAAALAVLAVLVVKLPLAPYIDHEIPFILFYAAVLFCTSNGGLGSGLFATLLSAFVGSYFFFEPRFNVHIADPEQSLRMLAFLIEGSVISLLGAAIHSLRQQARHYRESLEEKDRRLRGLNQVLVEMALRAPPAVSDPRLAVRDMLETAASTLLVARAGVWLLNESHTALRCLDLYEAISGSHSQAPDLLASNSPAYFAALPTQRCLPADDALADLRTAELADYLRPLGITSMLDAPVRIKGQLVGVVCLEHVGPPRHWEAEEEQFAGSLGDFAALKLKSCELRRAEETIREQASALEQAHDAIVVLDPDGRVRSWNRGAERLYGWPAGEAAGQHVVELLGWPQQAREETNQALAERGRWSGARRERTHSGAEVQTESYWTLLRDEEGRPRGQLVISADVTEKKVLEQQLMRAQRLESLGTLAGGIAHDLNNVLTPLAIGLDLLQMEDRRHAGLIDTLQTSVQRGAALLRQVLAFARRDGEGMGPVALGPVIREVKSLLDHSLPKSITLSTTVLHDLWMVLGNPTQLTQVLMNLCVNARDAMQEGGRLVIQATNRVVNIGDVELPPGATPGRFVVLLVTDTGTGIPPEVREKIFEPFFTTKPEGQGTGLGLATTAGIVRGGGGFILIDSEVGKGTTFAVYLRAVEGPAAPKLAGPAELPAGSGELVLVVDDEASIRELARAALEAHGYQVITAVDGHDGARKAEALQGKLNAILLDLMMPGLAGAALVEALKAAAPGVPVILTSGLVTAGSRGPGIGESAWVAKPYTAADLLQALRRVIAPAR